MNRVPSFSQPDALIPCISNAYFTTNYVARNWEVLLNIYFIADPHNKARVCHLLFTYSKTILMKYLNSKQNLRPEKGIYSYLVKFYCTIDTIYAELTCGECTQHNQIKDKWPWHGWKNEGDSKGYISEQTSSKQLSKILAAKNYSMFSQKHINNLKLRWAELLAVCFPTWQNFPTMSDLLDQEKKNVILPNVFGKRQIMKLVKKCSL